MDLLAHERLDMGERGLLMKQIRKKAVGSGVRGRSGRFNPS